MGSLKVNAFMVVGGVGRDYNGSTMSDSDNTDHYQGALLEEIREEIHAIHEGQAALTPLPAAVARLQEDMDEVKADVRTIKLVVTSNSSRLTDHESRLTKLEGAAQ